MNPPAGLEIVADESAQSYMRKYYTESFLPSHILNTCPSFNQKKFIRPDEAEDP